MLGPMSFPKPTSSLSLFWVIKRGKFGHFKEFFSNKESSGKGVRREEKRDSSWLQIGKPLGFLNPREKLSLGKKRKI